MVMLAEPVFATLVVYEGIEAYPEPAPIMISTFGMGGPIFCHVTVYVWFTCKVSPTLGFVILSPDRTICFHFFLLLETTLTFYCTVPSFTDLCRNR
jgi:hypothetical protein